MYDQMLQDFVTKFIPGFEWLVFLVVVHIITSTIGHIKNGDFKISEWPKFLGMWLLFMVGIISVNGVLAACSLLASSTILLPVVGVLQALVYGMYFSYYLDNIFKHLNMAGLPVNPGLIESIKSITDKIKNTFTGGGTTV